MQNRRISTQKTHRENVAPMKRVAYVAVAFLAGVLFPILIWVALFFAIREPLLQTSRRFASVILALLAGVLFPVLIWVGLVVVVREPLLLAVRRVAYAVSALLIGIAFPVLIWVGLVVAVSQWIQEKIPQREPARTIGEILATAGLTIQQEPLESQLVAVKVFAKQPMPEIHGLLARAGL